MTEVLLSKVSLHQKELSCTDQKRIAALYLKMQAFLAALKKLYYDYQGIYSWLLQMFHKWRISREFWWAYLLP